MRTSLTFKIKLESDYHLSAGSGLQSGADSALLRDDDGVPAIRGTTVTGLLRDSLWQLLQLKPLENYRHCRCSGNLAEDAPNYCSRANSSAVECPICRLFGTPDSPKQWRIGSARPVGLETPTTGEWQKNQSLTQIVQRVRISPATRRAEAQKLFSQENGDGRLSFHFTMVCEGDNEVATLQDEMAWWVAVARYVRQLGRSRRRGQGQCQISLEKVMIDSVTSEELTETALLIHFEKRFIEHALPFSLRAKAAPVDSISTLAPASHQVCIRLIVRTDEPVIMAQRAETGNLFATGPMITGAALRGALATQAAYRHDLNDKTIYEQFVKLFFREFVHFPVLYPTNKDSTSSLHPAIPAPRDLLTCKIFPGLGLASYQHNAKGFAAEPPGTEERCPHCEKGDKSLRSVSDFIFLTSTYHQNLTMGQRDEMHIRFNPYTQRVEPELLFGYTTLKTGQYFVGEMTLADEATWQSFQQMTGLPDKPYQRFTLYLGKASRRGYGRVTAYWEKYDADYDDEPVGLDQPLAQRVTNPTQVLTLTLLTDAIILDEWGRYHLSFEAGWLSQVLQMEITRLHVFAGIRPIDGFQGYSGLPRQRDLAIMAGSAVGFELVAPPADWLERLARIEQEGVGLRRHEGFGRLVFNHSVYHNQPGEVTSISLNDSLELTANIVLSQQPHSKSDQFIRDWEKKLNKESWDKCQDEEFTAIARWLHRNAGKPFAELRRQIERLGTPDETLIDQIGRTEYDARHKESKIKPAGLNFILQLMAKLETEAKDNEPNRIHGLTMLAKRIATEAGKERQA